MKAETKEKLELVHLVGHLPWGLKGLTIGYGGKKELSILMGIVSDNYFETELVIITKKSNVTFKDKICIDGFTPYLRPVSDMNKRITHKGETFVPSDKLKLKYGKSDVISINEFYTNKSIGIEDMDFVIEKLNEWHFDWKYNLIEKGLAISCNYLNTIENGKTKN